MTGSRVVAWKKEKVREREGEREIKRVRGREGEQEIKCNYRGVIEQLTSHQSQVKEWKS